MIPFSDFIAKARDEYGRLDAELQALEKKVRDAGDRADNWTKEQVGKLRADLGEARNKISYLAERVDLEGEEAVSDARRHWDALHAAVAAYRDHLEKPPAPRPPVQP